MSRSKTLQIDGITINHKVAESVVRNSDKPALSSRSGKDWTTLTYGEFEKAVKDFSLGLRSLGIERGDRVALLSENRSEWAIADIAILAAGGITVPIYSTLPPAQVTHILFDSGAKGIIASDKRQLAKIDLSKSRCPDLTVVVTMEETPGNDEAVCFSEVQERGRKYEPEESFETRRSSVRPTDLASLVYTSGTTGDPKGAMLSHQNFAAAVGMAEIWFPVPADATFLSFLPLCHVFERVTHYLSLSLGTHTYYAESIFKVADNMSEVRPVIMQSVPRLYESICERITDSISKAPATKKKFANWAINVGAKHSELVNKGAFVNPILASQNALADKLVLSKIRERLGGHLKFLVSGGAPLSPSTARLFNAINIPILEGYGLTETTAPLTCNPFHRAKVGTVGKAFAAVQLKIAPDGEILAKGPNVMGGYWNNPGATHEMFDADGWLHTGDIGKLDSAGYLTITDRKKDIIVLANGKNVAPQPIEGLLKQSNFITELVLLGDKAGTISALVGPNQEAISTWAKQNSISYPDTTTLMSSIEVKKLIKSEIDRLSGNLADYEKIRKIAILLEPLTIEKGELTPTLKVRRKVVMERHGKLLEPM